ncbi:hypothetical protein HMH01_03360 [Halovulum dunhuangense]|uniref:Uncharacterized protein n=2 Tax=Halovulum dunhuangense TaxID=1505036 RepID=A0A849KVM9_9RHOB|nr:hypothetical protein [Halovulum dunhuangense]
MGLADFEDDADMAEYVLGLSSRRAARALERRIEREPALRESYHEWIRMLAPMNSGFTPVRAPNVFSRVESRLFPAPAPRRKVPLWVPIALAGGAALVLAVKGALILEFIRLLF